MLRVLHLHLIDWLLLDTHLLPHMIHLMVHMLHLLVHLLHFNLELILLLHLGHLHLLLVLLLLLEGQLLLLVHVGVLLLLCGLVHVRVTAATHVVIVHINISNQILLSYEIAVNENLANGVLGFWGFVKHV